MRSFEVLALPDLEPAHPPCPSGRPLKLGQAYSSICDLGGRGPPPASGVSADFEAGLSGPWSDRCRRSLSSWEDRRSAIGRVGERPELLKRATSIIARPRS